MIMLRIYNSLTQQKELFKPLVPGKAKIYVCGPTVYDFAHIGNARTYAAFDVVIRYLRWRDYDVTYVRNITDIDDKIIKRANEKNEHFSAVVERFTNAIHEDFSSLGLLPPDHEPTATQYIPHMIKMIENLITKNHAYIASNGDVYYDVRSCKHYGELSHRNIDQLESGARVEVNDVKKDPLDFVLWKLAKPGEPYWASPWGEGRPGWHIECSAMSTDLLGDTFDIHGGGKDLIFPHHENEIAQSEAATDKKFVNLWMHTGYLQMEKEKMSKSLGNFLTIRDLLNQHAPEVLRFFLISKHYRSPLQYSEDSLKEAANALDRLYNALRGLSVTNEVDKNSLQQAPLNHYLEKFTEAMDDDFNAPIAFSILFDLAHDIQRHREKDLTMAVALGSLLKMLGGVFNILQDDPDLFLKTGKSDVDAVKIETLIAARNAARERRDWREADRIRDELSSIDVVIEDTPQGTLWKAVK